MPYYQSFIVLTFVVFL